MKIIVEICEHCGGPNDRKEYSNWCRRCADQEAERVRIDKETRQREFEEHMRNRPA